LENKLEKLAIKKLLQEYNFLMTDDSYKKEVVETYKSTFLELISKKRKELNIEPKTEQLHPEEEEQKQKQKFPEILIENVDDNVKAKIKKIYRDIVKKTHPDITDSKELVDIYMRATEAQEKYNLFELYKICSELQIEVELDKEDIKLLEELIENKKKELKSLESSFIWLWVHSTTEEQKQKVIELFIEKHG
jgi:hypothetical protein